jgi:hypothetical protein
LHIPDQAVAPEDSFLLDPQAASEWLASLPVASIGETARLTFNALVDANRTEMPDLVRARVVEMFREPVRYLCKNLEKHFLDLGFPLSEKGHKAALLARELNAELAIGYKIVIERLLRNQVKRLDEKLLVLALHRATLYLGRVLYRSVTIYEPWPAGVWRELHSLYTYAEQNRLLAVSVKDPLAASSGEATIERAYRRILVFAACNPYRMRQSDIRRVFAHTLEWVQHAELLRGEQENENTGRFSVDLLADEPPEHRAMARPVPERRVRMLDLRGLIRKLRDGFERGEFSKETRDKIGTVLVRDLIRHWNDPPKRRYVRTHLHFELHILAGITPIHQALSGGEAEAPPRPAAFTPSSSPRVPVWAEGAPSNLGLAPLDSGLMDDPFTDAGRTGREPPARTTGNDVEWQNPPKPPPRQHAPYPVQTFNESAGGYCIRWPVEHPTKIKVGEIVGIRDGDDNRKYSLGVVRWMRQDPARELELGVQIIASRCQPGELGTSSVKAAARNPNKPRFACLLLPESGPDNHKPSLVTSASNLDSGTTLWLSSRGQERRIQLSGIIEASGAFSRYEFQLLGQATPQSTPKAGSDRGFDGLWNQL